jgi:hypothetical protein
MNKDLCKVQVNAPPSLEIPVKFFERYCALPNNSAMSARRASRWSYSRDSFYRFNELYDKRRRVGVKRSAARSRC